VGVHHLFIKQYNRVKLFSLFVALFLITLLAAAPSLAQEPVSDVPDFVPGEILVKFKPSTDTQNKQQRLVEVQGKVARSIKGLEVLKVEVPPGQELATLEKLQARGDVEFVTLNYRIHALETPNDPWYQSGEQWGLAQIKAAEAWDLTTGSNSVTIAVIDTGVDLDHPELQSNIVPGYDYVNFDNFADDDNGHGTHVAGIAAAKGNNGQGVAGLNWKARIMPLKILDYNGDGDVFNLAQAILEAADRGAQVINLSLGGNCPYNDWTAVQQAIDEATAKGVLVIAASGNQGLSSVFCPAALDKVIAVGSTTQSDFLSYFSNYGAELDVVAPGSNIYSTLPGGAYGYKSGTSMATPYVAGLAALIWSLNTNLSPEAVSQIIQTTADDLGSPGWDEAFGYGRINAGRAVSQIDTISLTNAVGQKLTAPILFLVDGDDTFLPLTSKIYVATGSPEIINWTAKVASPVSWLNLSPPTQGQVSALSTAQFTLSVTRPASYGTHLATITVTGKTSAGVEIDSQTAQIQVTYKPQLQRFLFPVIFKKGKFP
jgi:thermitase